jgi:hypothetical protein
MAARWLRPRSSRQLESAGSFHRAGQTKLQVEDRPRSKGFGANRGRFGGAPPDGGRNVPKSQPTSRSAHMKLRLSYHAKITSLCCKPLRRRRKWGKRDSLARLPGSGTNTTGATLVILL